MKVFVLLTIVTIFSTNVVASNQTQERFYRAGDKEILVQGGFDFTETRIEIESDNPNIPSSEGKVASTLYSIEAQYGVHESVAVGVNIRYLSSGTKRDSMRNPGIFIKGEFSDFHYLARYNISLGDSENDNSYEGASFLDFQFGYEFTERLGLLIKLQPGYEYTFKYDDGSTEKDDRGGDNAISVNYEFNFSENILGLTAGLRSIENTTRGFDDLDFFQTAVYANLKALGVEFLPSLELNFSSREIGDGELKYTRKITFSEFKLEARKRF